MKRLQCCVAGLSCFIYRKVILALSRLHMVSGVGYINTSNLRVCMLMERQLFFKVEQSSNGINPRVTSPRPPLEYIITRPSQDRRQIEVNLTGKQEP